MNNPHPYYIILLVAVLSAGLIFFQIFSAHTSGSINSQMKQHFSSILCLGDSLTEGVSIPTSHSYTIQLSERLKQSGYAASIKQAGVSGDMVSRGFKIRQRQLYQEWFPRNYSLTIILGGINDIGRGRLRAEEIQQSLSELYETARNHGSRVLAMTLMQVDRPAYWINELETQRRKVNEWIKTAAISDPNIIGLIDLDRLIPPTKEDFSDGLHLTHGGYDRMGNLIADFIINKCL